MVLGDFSSEYLSSDVHSGTCEALSRLSRCGQLSAENICGDACWSRQLDACHVQHAGWTTTCNGPVQCRHIEALIQELVLLVQRSEEYNSFMTTRMKDAVTAEVEQLNAAAAAAATPRGAARAGSLQRHRSSGLQYPETPRAAAGRDTVAGELLPMGFGC